MASMGELAILLRADNQITPELNAVNASLVTNESHKAEYFSLRASRNKGWKSSN